MDTIRRLSEEYIVVYMVDEQRIEEIPGYERWRQELSWRGGEWLIQYGLYWWLRMSTGLGRFMTPQRMWFRDTWPHHAFRRRERLKSQQRTSQKRGPAELRFPDPDFHVAESEIFKHWRTRWKEPGTQIYDYRTTDTMGTMYVWDDDPDSGWLQGLPPRLWRPKKVKDMRRMKNTFWGRFDWASDSKLEKTVKYHKDIRKFPYFRLHGKGKGKTPSTTSTPKPKEKKQRTFRFIKEPRVPLSATFEFSFDKEIVRKEDGVQVLHHDKSYIQPSRIPSTDFSEHEFEFEDVNLNLRPKPKPKKKDHPKIRKFFMGCDTKSACLKDYAPWFRIQIGLCLLRMFQVLMALCWWYNAKNSCRGKKSSAVCDHLKGQSAGSVFPYFVIYYITSCKFTLHHSLPDLLKFFNCGRGHQIWMFGIQTWTFVHIFTAIYFMIPGHFPFMLISGLRGMLPVLLWLLLYFRVKYNRKIENMPYWLYYEGPRDLRRMTYKNHEVTWYLTEHVYFACHRQTSQTFIDSKFFERGYFTRNHIFLIFTIILITCPITVGKLGAFASKDFFFGASQVIFCLFFGGAFVIYPFRKLHAYFYNRAFITDYHSTDILMLAMKT